MLYSHSHQEQSFDFFASFLRNLLSGDSRYLPLIEPVIKDAQSLVKNEKDYFQIDRHGFEVIVFLAKNAPDYFTNVDIDHLSEKDFQYILNLITEKKGLILA